MRVAGFFAPRVTRAAGDTFLESSSSSFFMLQMYLNFSIISLNSRCIEVPHKRNYGKNGLQGFYYNTLVHGRTVLAVSHGAIITYFYYLR